MLSSAPMAKKSKHKDTDELIARRTLSAARFFYDQAGRAHITHYEYYVEAAIVFAWMVLEHLEKEFGKTPEAKQWVKNLEENNLTIKELKKQRNSLSHEQPISINPSQKEGLYSAAYAKLPDQLNEIKTIVDECEKLFG